MKVFTLSQRTGYVKRVAGCVTLLSICALVFGQTGRGPETFEERLGRDDGAAFAILFGANLRANLDVCDCNHPRGGLARRVGYVDGFKKKFKEVPVIQVEAGNFLSDSTNYRGSMTPLVMLQNRQIFAAYDRFPIDVINLARTDLPYARTLFRGEGLVEGTPSLQAIESVVSANGVFDDTSQAPPPYLIKEVTGPRIGGRQKKVRVAFVGLAEGARVAEGIDARVRDIFKEARRVVPRARKESDLLVIVAHATTDTAQRLAEQNPEADIVIAGDTGGAVNPRQVGNALIVGAAPGNTQEGDLRVYISKTGEFTYTFRSLDLDATVPADPEALAFAEAAREETARFKSSSQ